MQRMSDMLTRWLDGNLRQNQEGDSAGTQDQSDQASAGTEQEPVQESTSTQSVSAAESLSQSSDSRENEILPVQNNLSEGVEPVCERLQGTSAIETQSVSENVIDSHLNEQFVEHLSEGQSCDKQEEMVYEFSEESRDTEKNTNGNCLP